MSLIVFQNFLPKPLRDIVERAGAENDVKFTLQPEIEHVRLKKIDLRSGPVSRPEPAASNAVT